MRGKNSRVCIRSEHTALTAGKRKKFQIENLIDVM